jgi:hypothetical protein
MVEQVERRKLSPSDKKFRRGLYVMLVVLGLLAAGGVLYGKQAHNDAMSAQASAKKADIKNNELLKQLANLLQQMKEASVDAANRSAAAAKQREELLARQQALERFILEILANSSDPATQKAAREFLDENKPTPTASPSTTPRAEPSRPSYSPSPGPTASSSATPGPTPTPTGTTLCIGTQEATICATLPPIIPLRAAMR